MSDPNAAPPYEPPAYQPPSAQQPGYQAPAPTGAPLSAPTGAPLSAADDKLWASLSHFGNIILLVPALIIHLVFRGRGPLVTQESKEALNWTINVTGAIIVINIVSTIFGFIPFIGGILAFLLSLVWVAILIVNLVFAIIGGVRVNGGGTYRYPFNYRWIK